MTGSDSDLTGLLRAWRQGDPKALDELVPQVYQELHKMAVSQIRAENPGHTLSATSLLHESLLKLMQSESHPDWQDRKHFYVVASRAMRQLLVDYARKKRTLKRSAPPAELAGSGGEGRLAHWDMIDLDRALAKLQSSEPRRAKMLELRYFGGLSQLEVAEVMEISTSTVSRELRMTEAWLANEIQGGQEDGEPS